MTANDVFLHIVTIGASTVRGADGAMLQHERVRHPNLLQLSLNGSSP